MPRIKRRLPHLKDVTEAIHYWAVLDLFASHFASTNMPVVSEHLKAACAEINRIWEEGKFNDGRTNR